MPLSKIRSSANFPLFRLACRRPGLGQHAIKRGAVEKLSAQDHAAYFRGITNVGERIGLEQDQVGDFSRLNRPPAAFAGRFQELRRLERRCLQRLERTEAGFDQKLQFLVQTWSGKIKGIERIGASHHLDSGCVHGTRELQVVLELREIPLCELGRDLFVNFVRRPARAQSRREIGEFRWIALR